MNQHMNVLKEKVALVTASSKGIGKGVARALAIAGCKVAICSRSQENLDRALADLQSVSGSRIVGYAGDLGDVSFLNQLADRTSADFGAPIQILINNNGGPPMAQAESASDEQWASALDRNFMSTVRLSRLVVPKMKELGWGRILNLTSTTAKEPDPGMVLSNATRAAVSAFAKTLACEIAGDGITVNTVLTGACLTERMYDLLRQEAEASNLSREEVLERTNKLLPVGFIPEPEEFGRFVVSLLGEDSRFLTGVSLEYDGGLTRGIF